MAKSAERSTQKAAQKIVPQSTIEKKKDTKSQEMLEDAYAEDITNYIKKLTEDATHLYPGVVGRASQSKSFFWLESIRNI